MTARDIQDELKSNKYPWLLAKGFDTSCPVSNFIEKSKINDNSNVNIKLYKKKKKKIEISFATSFPPNMPCYLLFSLQNCFQNTIKVY